MKLKTRLIVSFCAIILVPVVLFVIIMMTTGNRQLKYLEEYGNDLQQYEQHTLGIESPQAADGSLQAGSGGLQTADGSSQAGSGGPQTADGSLQAGSGGLQTADGSLQAGNGGPQTGNALPAAARMIPEIRMFLKNMSVAAILILLLTACLLIGWIYTGINVPLMKLRKATHNIAEGNLDFTLDVTGDDEISDLCRDFEEMRRRLRESTEEKIEYDRESKELISNISHDLKTPITAIKGYVEGIMDGVADTPEKMDRYIRTIYNKANDMDRLINELTFYSKIDTNRIPYTFNKINVSSYFEDCCEEVGLDLESKNIDFSYQNYVDESVEVIADAEQIKRVIDNIIGNSVKYMDKAKGRISIRVKDVGDFVQVEIEDNGKGIGAKELPYIFDRFYRTDTSRSSATGGSGIGLSIVRKIVEDHGGKIWAGSKPGTGTVMYFVLRKVTVDAA